MEQEYIEQLERFARLKTPEWKLRQANDTYEEICETYCWIRNLAKDMLRGDEQFSKRDQHRLIILLIRANNLGNEVLEDIEI